MRRREFIVGFGIAAAWPFSARGEQNSRAPRLAILIGTSESDPQSRSWLAGFEEQLQKLGWRRDSNIRIEIYWGNGVEKRVREQAQQLVNEPPDAIFSVGTAATGAIKEATTSIPVVFAVVNDPVAQGFVASMARPGGNMTGFSLLDYATLSKSMALLKQIAPVSRIAFLFNPETYPYYEKYLTVVAGSSITPLPLAGLRVRSKEEIEPAIGTLTPEVGLLVAPDTFTNVHRVEIIRSAALHRIAATYPYRQFVQDGGLMAYGPNPADLVREAATYVDRILKGQKPGELPIQAASKFELIINAKTAEGLGLAVPSDILFTADEVIE